MGIKLTSEYEEILRKRALAFLEHAQIAFEREEYDLVIFYIEQSLQLYLKYLLYKKIGDFPKTHSIIRLIKDVTAVYESKELENLYKTNLEAFNLLEEAYITSRYLPRSYEREIAERMLEFARRVLEVLKCLK